MERINEFDRFAERVSKHIDNKKARKEVRGEIYDHLIDLSETLISEGMSEAEARKKAVEIMSDADKLSTDFDRVHTPKMKARHYILIAATVIAVIITVICRINAYNQRETDQKIFPDKSSEISYFVLSDLNIEIEKVLI